jgi:hypothetical protein
LSKKNQKEICGCLKQIETTLEFPKHLQNHCIGQDNKESPRNKGHIPEGTRRKEPSGAHASLLKNEGNVSS